MVLSNKKLRALLYGFCGTKKYTRHFTGFLYTEGVAHLADLFGAYWLIDAIFSWQCEIRDVPFQVWQLKVGNDRTAVLTMREDSDAPILVKQKIKYTDFPTGEIKLYFQNGVLFLPSEY